MKYVNSKVVLLPSEGETIVGQIEYFSNCNTYQIYKGGSSIGKGYFVYILSNQEEIEDGDYYYHPMEESVKKYKKEEIDGNLLDYGFYKVIATDNPNLKVNKFKTGALSSLEYPLPKPSKAFLEKLCDEGGKIEEVSVAYVVKTNAALSYRRYVYLTPTTGKMYIPNGRNFPAESDDHYVLGREIELEDYEVETELSVSNNGTITIKPLIEPTFTQSQVIKLFVECTYEMAQQIIGNRGKDPIVPSFWIREKLNDKTPMINERKYSREEVEDFAFNLYYRLGYDEFGQPRYAEPYEIQEFMKNNLK